MIKGHTCFISGKIIVPLLLLFNCVPVLLYSQQTADQLQSEKGLPFITNYSAKTYNGVPQVWSVQEDESGIMYFGSTGNLLEYDGNKWQKIPRSTGSTAGTVRSMTKYKDGTIYVGSDGDIGYLAKDSLGQTKFLSLLNLIPKEYRNFFDIWTIYTTDNSIYFQSREYIFRLRDPKNNEAGKANIKVWKPQSQFMYAFYLDGEYYVHQQGLGLYKMTNDSLVLIPGSEFLGKERMQVMMPYISGPNGEKQYLIGQFYSGLHIYNGKSFRSFATKADAILKSGNLLYKGIQLKNGNYVLSLTGNGFVIIDQKGNLLQLINRNAGLQNESIYANYLDSKGALWLALDNGISRIEINSPLTQFTLQSGINSGVLTMKRFDGNLYIGTSNGLLVYDSTRKFFEPVVGVSKNQIFALVINGDELLVASDGLFAIKNKKAFTIHPSISGDFTLSALYIPKKYPDLLLGGGTFGLGFFDRKKSTNVSGQKNPWNFKGLIPGITERIIIFSEDKDGTIWAGSSNGVAYRLSIFPDEKNNPDLTKTKIDTIKSNKDIRNFVGGVIPINGTTYFQADSFLYIFDKSKQQFLADTTFGKFPNGNVGTDLLITEDQLGRVWINIDKQTRLAIPQKESGYRIENAGLNSLADYSFSDFFSEKNGITWIATTDALVRFDENLEKNTDQSFKTIIRYIGAGKTRLSTDILAEQKSFPVSFKNNTLRFEYAAPYFEQENKTRYQTRLEGFENDWSPLDNNYYKEYTNLNAGKYTFHVRAVSINGKQSDEATYSFEILPPWYRSWWAYSLYALIALAILYFIIKWRTHHLHEKHRELEKIVTERTGQLSQRVEELAVINSVQEGLVREMDMQGIYELVGEKIREIFNAQVMDIVTYDKNKNLVEDKYSFEKGDRTLIGSWTPAGFGKHVIETGQLILINEDLEKKAIEFNSKPIYGEAPKSAVFVPLITGSEVKGIISLQDLDKEHAFTDADVNLLTTLANSMSMALESARRFHETNRLLKETEQRTAELSVINSVQEGLAKELDIQGIYELVGEKVREIFNAQVIDIVTYDAKLNLIEDRYAYEKGDTTLLGPREPNGIRKNIIETGQSFVINHDYEKISQQYDNTILIGEQPKSIVVVPLISGGKVNGMISLQNLDRENVFTDADVNLLTTLANSMSVALENARLFDETNRLLKETEQRTAELAVINSVQEGLVREMDMNGIYKLVGDRLLKIFPDTETLVIRTFDHETGLEHFHYTVENGEHLQISPRPFIWESRQLISTKKPLDIENNYEEISIQNGESAVTEGLPVKSAVFVPMIVGEQVKGSISLQNVDRENAFNESDIRLLTTLTNSMSVALENARLFDETSRLLKETEQRTAELAVINSVQEGLAKELDMQAIYDLVGDRIRNLFDAQVVGIATFDHQAGTEHFKYVFEKGTRYHPEPRPFDKLRQHLIKTRQKILINNDFIEAYNKFGMKAVSGTELPKSALFVPLVIGDKITSYVTLQNIDRENAFSDSDVRLLETLSNSMSVALENARLFDETSRLLKETEQRTAELAVINSIQEGLAKELDIQAIYDLVGDKLGEVMNTLDIDIRLFSPETKQVFYPYVRDHGQKIEVPTSQMIGMSKHVFKTGQTLIINEQLAERMTELGSTILPGTQMEKSFMAVPIMAGNTALGMVCISNYEKENAFSNSDVRLLQTVVSAMSVALKNANLFDETNRLLKETEQRTAELAVINSVQEGLAKELDMQGIYDLVGDRVQKLFQTHAVIIASLDLVNGIEHFNYVFENGLKYKLDDRPFNKLREKLIDKKQTIYIETEDMARNEYGITAIGDTKMPRSLMFVPLLSGNNIRGYVSIQNIDKENAFNETDIRLLETLANSMSVALENARLFDETSRLLKETEQRTAELSVINSVQEGLVKEFKSKEMYELVGERLCELFDTQTVMIRTFELEKGIEHWRYAIEKRERQYTDPRPLIWANKEMIKTHKPILINENYVETAKKYGGSGVSMGKAPKSAVFVPMIVGDIVRGSVSLQNVDRENAFTESDLRLLMTLTNSLSVAVENARLFDETTILLAETKQRAAELSTVNSISKVLASQLDADDLIKLVGDQLKDLFNANIVYLALLNKKTKIIDFPYQFGDDMPPMKLGTGLTSKIIQNGEPLLINKDLQELRAQMGIKQIGVPAASYLGVPIPVGDENIGVLSVQSTEQENRFNENDLRLLSTIASSVGVALRNATLFEEVKLAKMEAETASKLAEKANEAKSAFLSTVSHELRTPLTSVLGFAKIIKKRLEERIFPIVDQADAKTGKAVNQISENLKVVISEGERLTHLINDVLDLAKIEAGKMDFNQENVSMPEVAERAIAATTSLFDQKALKLIRKIDTDVPEIIGDKDKLIQVIINLISNSVKFTDEGSITCSVFKQKDELIVSIADTGIGIAPEDFGAVFEQFKQVGGDTLTDKPKGTGLGLPICKEIVEHLGGRIWLDSERGKGSTFSFALPINKATAARPIHLDDLVRQLKEQVAHSQLHLKGSSNILIVDDDDSIRSLLQQELGDAGYNIDQARNGKEALARVRANRPDLIILDIMMPEMNGFDVAAVLKNDPETMDIPIIVLSVVQDKARGFRIGIDRYLTKPIDTGLLFNEIGSLLEQGKSKKKVMIVDEDSAAVNALIDVLTTKGYDVMESTEKELMEKAVANLPDIIIINSLLSGKQDIVKTLRFEKGLENVLFVVYQ